MSQRFEIAMGYPSELISSQPIRQILNKLLINKSDANNDQARNITVSPVQAPLCGTLVCN